MLNTELQLIWQVFLFIFLPFFSTDLNGKLSLIMATTAQISQANSRRMIKIFLYPGSVHTQCVEEASGTV